MEKSGNWFEYYKVWKKHLWRIGVFSKVAYKKDKKKTKNNTNTLIKTQRPQAYI